MVEFEIGFCKQTGSLTGRLYYPVALEQEENFVRLRSFLRVVDEVRYARTKAIWFEAEKAMYKYLLVQYPNRFVMRNARTEALLMQI